mgnify:CR=1 FL=1
MDQHESKEQLNEESNTDVQILNEETVEKEESKQYKYAGFWMRFWAYIIDVIVVFSINGIVLSPLLFVNDGAPIEISYWTLNGILAGVIYYAYFLVMTKIFGQTIGKMILGLKVIRENDEPLTWLDLIFREVVGRFLHNVFMILKLLYLVVAFSNEKQGVHDMIGNTRVIHV